jgi:hypothetical protein
MIETVVAQGVQSRVPAALPLPDEQQVRVGVLKTSSGLASRLDPSSGLARLSTGRRTQYSMIFPSKSWTELDSCCQC